MRNSLVVIPLFFTIAVLTGCFYRQPKVVVENRSGHAVDSVVFFVFDQPVAAMGRIPVNSVVERILPGSSLNSKHDLFVGAYGKIGEEKFEIATWFTDLGADYNEARIVINPGNRGRIVLK